jgi:hypothetical protein
LRNLVALALQLAFLALLVGALGDPLWSWQKRDARHVVFVIDNSASMSARDEGESQTRLERAALVARRMIASLRSLDSAAVVTAGGQPQVACGTTSDTRLLTESVDAVSPTDNPTHLRDAVELARRLAVDKERREIIVLTDGGDSHVAELTTSSDVALYGFGEKTANTAITSFQVRRQIADTTSFQVLVEVTNFGDEEVQCRLDLELEGNVVDVVPLTLKPGEPWRQTLDHTSSDGGRLIAKLDVNDALATDNQAIAVLPRQEPIPVLLVTPGSLFLRSVFTSIANVDLTLATELPSEIPAGTIVVVHRTPLEKIPSGDVIVIDPQSSSDLWTLGGDVAEPIVADQAVDSPLTAHIRLQNTLLPGAKMMQFTGKAVPLLKSPAETPFYAHLPRPKGNVLVLSVNLDDGDLPLRIAFPVMIKNAVEFFLGGKGALRPALPTGQVASVAAPERADTNTGSKPQSKPLPSTDENNESVERRVDVEQRELVFKSPAGDSRVVLASGETLSVGPFDRAGLWLIGPDEELRQPELDIMRPEFVPIAVNLANPQESDLRPRAELQSAPLASAVWGGHSLWFYLCFFAAVGTCLEWFLYQRRIVA